MSSEGDQSDVTTLSHWDVTVLVFTLSVSAGIGIYYRFTGGRQRTTREFLLADGNMSVVPVAFSLMASFMSAVTLLGVPKENYFFGIQFFLINISYIVGTPVAAFVFLPVFYRLQCVSAYEYLERRFGRTIRLMASAIFIIQMVFYMSVVVYAPAVTLQATTHLSKWAAVLSVGVVCTFYCTIGGMKAVIWTDVFQSLLMFGSMVAIVIAGTLRVGGLANVMNAAKEGGRLALWGFSVNPEDRHTFWSLVIGGFFLYVSLYGVNQIQVQRLMTVQKLRTAQLALFINWPILTALSFVSCFTGLVIFANFQDCDPYISKKIKDQDEILPYFVMKFFGHLTGLPGLFVAGIFSGALSTVSSAINSLAAVSYEDFIKPFRKGNNSHELIIVKVIAMLYGILCVLMTGVVERLGGVLQASFVFFGIGGGPLLGAFCLGMLVPRCSQKAALMGLAFGLLAGLWIGTGALLEAAKPQPLPLPHDHCPADTEFRNSTNYEKHCSSYLIICNLSYQWYTFASWLVTFVVGLLASFAWPTAVPVSEDFLSPIIGRRFRSSESFKEHGLEQLDHFDKL